MSTQSIKQTTIEGIRDGIDNSIACIAKKYILEDKFGIKNKVNKKDLFSLLYYKKYFNERYCKQKVTIDIINKVNKTIQKYN